MSVIADIADAIVTELAVVNVTAARKYLPVHSIEELAAPVVTVVPRSAVIQTVSRAQSAWECVIDIGVQFKVGDVDSDIDTMLDFVQSIADFFRMRPLTSIGASFMKMEHDPVVAAKAMEEHRVLTSVLKITYKVRR